VFGYDSVPILENITFVLHSQETLAVIGPNGTGKTTLLKCIDGLLKHQKGSIFLDGKPVKGMHRKEIAKCIGYVPQTASTIFPFTVFDMVLLGRYPHGNRQRGKRNLEKAFKALRLLGIEDLAMRKFSEISGGQQQKVTIARAIAQEAEILLLDEPTSNLDIMHQLEVMELLKHLVKRNEMSAIISMHDLNLTSRYADKVIMLDQGKIVAAGDPFSVLTPENIASVYHVEVVVKRVQQKPHIVPLRPLSNYSCRRLEG
jgi:iron complex transport system ATP-binding protein